MRSIVVASSDKAYGAHAVLPYDETFALQGSHPYDVSKSCADLIAYSYFNTYGTPVCVTRCGNLFGSGDMNWSRIVPGTIRWLHAGERPLIRSDGTPTRDYVHTRDIIEGYLLLSEKMDDAALHGRAYNFGTGEPLSVLELTNRIAKLMDRTDIEPDVRNEAKAEIQDQYLAADRARSELGWKPGATLDARLAETIDWYRAYLDRAET